VSSDEQRKVTLRSERRGENSFSLRAYVDPEGNLHMDGQDLGPVTASVSSDGEYEYFKTIAASDVPQFLSLLGAPADADVLDVLESNWSGEASWELERLLRESGIPVDVFTYGG
jgi:hypothetical protein